MELKVFCVLFCVIILPCSGARLGKSDESNAISRFSRDIGFMRFKRQSNNVCQGNNNTLCLPDGIDTAPISLVECREGQCICADCFMINDSSGRCRVCSDYPFIEGSGPGQCGIDSRQSQLTAFLLSLFLSSTGAANFYIGRSDIAGGQLFLFILLLTMSYSLCCFPCCLACCLSKEDVKGSIFFIVFMLIFALLLILASLAIWAWWVADLIIFATNQRLAGSGCELMNNL